MHFQPTQNIIDSDAEILVNTVNTVGVMGKGVALAFRKAFPEIMEPYDAACRDRRLVPGTFQVLRLEDGRRVLNLATKDHWRDPSRYEWVGAGLVYINRYLREVVGQPTSLCLPMPGAGNGGLDPARVQQMIRTYLHPAIAEGHDIRLCADEIPPIPDPVFYAGVGARKTPGDVLEQMRELASLLAEDGMTLRSGGAIGADTAFHEGAREVDPKAAEIYLPGPNPSIPDGICSLSPVFTRLALNFHPSPARIEKQDFVLKLMARNGCQVFGEDFQVPSSALICWTPRGKGEGGTGQAIRLARSVGIPVVDLGAPGFSGMRVADIHDLVREEIRQFRSQRGLHRETSAAPVPMP